MIRAKCDTTQLFSRLYLASLVRPVEIRSILKAPGKLRNAFESKRSDKADYFFRLLIKITFSREQFQSLKSFPLYSGS